jgi:hypothetical protein
MGMEDSLKVLNYKDDTMASGKQKGINNIDNSDIPGKSYLILFICKNQTLIYKLFLIRSKKRAEKVRQGRRQISEK